MTHGLRGITRAACVLAVLAAGAGPARADDALAGRDCLKDPRGNELQLFIENDSFGATDQYYTHGLKLGVGVRGECLYNLFRKPSDELLRRIREIGGAEIGKASNFGLFIGQNLYTPRDITIAAPQPFDRPWAAWSYIGTVAQVVTDQRLHTVEVDLGVVGPPALGKQVQTFWHERVVDAPTPQGWGNQIRAEPGLLITYVHKRRYGEANGLQLIPHTGFSAGTIMTHARAGGLLRYGRSMTGFGPDGIEPGGAMLKNTRADDGAGGSREWFVFAGLDARLIAHNIFLDGSLFRDGPGVQRRDAVHDRIAGFSLRVDRLRFSVTRIRRSEEFRTPVSTGGEQRFYSINLGYEFR